jgi:hypothetical protein
MYKTQTKIYGLFSQSVPHKQSSKNSVNPVFFRKRPDEDHLDFMHRLIRLNFRAETIAHHTGFPVESIQYVMSRNGFLVK